MPPDYVLFLCRHFSTRVYIDPSMPFTPVQIINDPRVPEGKRNLIRDRFPQLEFLIISGWDGTESLDGYYVGSRKIPRELLSPLDIVRASGSSMDVDVAKYLLENYRFNRSQPTAPKLNDVSIKGHVFLL